MGMVWRFLAVFVLMRSWTLQAFLLPPSANPVSAGTCPDPSCVARSCGSACTKCDCSNVTAISYPTLSTLVAATTTGCTRVFSRSGVIASPGFPVSYRANYDCDYMIDLGDGYETGMKYVQLQFDSLDLQACSGCQCDFLELVNTNFPARLCSTRQAVPGRYYKVQAATNTTRFIQLRFHSDSQTTSTGFQLHYRVAWGNSTNTCEPVTCSVKCPLGLQQDFIGCPTCQCASVGASAPGGTVFNEVLKKLTALQTQVSTLDSALQAVKTEIQSIFNIVQQSGGHN